MKWRKKALKWWWRYVIVAYAEEPENYRKPPVDGILLGGSFTLRRTAYKMWMLQNSFGDRLYVYSRAYWNRCH